MFTARLHRLWMLYGVAISCATALQAQPICPGDTNADGVVDPLDTGFVLSHFACDSDTDPDCAAADINGDGIVDPLDAGFVLSRFGTCTAFDPLFGTPAFAVEGRPLLLAAEDLDGDGWLEFGVIYTNLQKLDIMQLNDANAYVVADSYPLSWPVSALALTDLDGDGDLDAAMPSAEGNRVITLTNDGSGTLTPSTSIAAGPEPQDIEAVDLDGDGRTDLVITNPAVATLSLLRNEGDMNFTLETLPLIRPLPIDVESADLNGDQAVDLLIADSGGLEVLINDGQGGFPTAIAYGDMTSSHALTVGDWDGDGDLDAAISDPLDLKIQLFTNFGDGSFEIGVGLPMESEPTALNTADFNNDGAPDIAVTLKSGRVLSFLLNEGGGSFDIVNTTSSAGPGFLTAADLNFDHRFDLIVGYDKAQQVVAMLNGPAGLLNSRQDYYPSDGPGGLAVGFFNSDPYPDVAVTINEDEVVQTYVNDGVGGLLPDQVSDVSGWANGLSAEDFNGDGRVDLAAITNTDGPPITMLLNNGCELPDIGPGYSFLGGLVEITAGELNGDDHIDIVLTSAACECFGIAINTGKGSFFEEAEYYVSGDGDVALGDLDGDADTDIAYADYSGGVYTLMNQGNATFDDAVLLQMFNGAGAIGVADLDNDGDSDLIVADSGEEIVILLNEGDGHFSDSTYEARGTGSTLHIVDLDGDGDEDIAAPTSDFGVDWGGDFGAVVVLLNAGDGSFQAAQYYANAGADGWFVETVDLDMDGDRDLVATQYEEGIFSVFPNRMKTCLIEDGCTSQIPTDSGYVDCNENQIGDSCELGGASAYPTVLAENTTGLDDYYFIGAPNGYADGIGQNVVIYDLVNAKVVDQEGADFNVYEDVGFDDFEDIDVLISKDGIHFISVSESEGPVVPIPGAEAHDDVNAARSYDLDGSGWDRARYIQVEGLTSGNSDFWTGFQLDAIGIIHLSVGNDCNFNQIPDDCDIADGTSSDEDRDGLPDECAEG